MYFYIYIYIYTSIYRYVHIYAYSLLSPLICMPPGSVRLEEGAVPVLHNVCFEVLQPIGSLICLATVWMSNMLNELNHCDMVKESQFLEKLDRYYCLFMVQTAGCLACLPWVEFYHSYHDAIES